MKEQAFSFDADTMVRTASLFEAKRNALPPDSIKALAIAIVSHLSAQPNTPLPSEGAVISEASVAAFCDALIDPSPAAALRFIAARRAEGVTRQDVYLGYIGAAARRLGEGWENDTLSFVDVTIGTGHLYALMRSMRSEARDVVLPFDPRRRALFATVPGETHSVGITVAADLFRDEGWEIDLQVGLEHKALVAHIERTKPPIIGLSFSTDGRFDELAHLVVATRIIIPHAIIGVAGGDGLDSDRVRNIVDIDLLFEDATSARLELERLIQRAG